MAAAGMMKHAIFGLVLCALSNSWTFASGPPTRVPVTRFEAALIESMRLSATRTLAERKQLLATMVDQSFDLTTVSRAVIGSYWEGLSASERAGLSQRIRDYAITTLATRFVNFEGERFEARDSASLDAHHARVRSIFIGATGRQTQLDYVVRRNDDEHRIVNVYFDGVSGTDIQRGEFAVFLREGGAARLMAKLDELIEAQGR